MVDGILRPCNVARSWHWFRQVTAPCNVACGSGIVTANSPSGSRAIPCNMTRGSGMTCHWICPNVCHIGILLLVSISTISPQSTCHSAPVCEVLSKLDHHRQKKNDVMSIFKVADFRHFGFQGSNNGLFEKPMYDFLDRSSIETIAVNCLDKDEQQWKRLNWFNSRRVRVQCRMRTATCDDNETTTLLIDVVRPPTSDLWLLRAEVVHLPSPNSSVRFVCQLRTRLNNPQPSY